MVVSRNRMKIPLGASQPTSDNISYVALKQWKGEQVEDLQLDLRMARNKIELLQKENKKMANALRGVLAIVGNDPGPFYNNIRACARKPFMTWDKMGDS